MTKILLLIPFLLLSCKSIPQKNMEAIQLASVYVYLDFKEKGYTTLGAYTHFDGLSIQGTRKIEISLANLKKLEEIMKSAKQFKHFQRKLAGGLIFSEIQYEGVVQKSRVVISVETESAYIMDLTNRQDFVVRNQEYIKWLSDFSDHLKSQ